MLSCKVYKMGNKLGTYFTKDIFKIIKIKKGKLVSLNLSNKKDNAFYITKFNKIISFRKEIIKKLELKKEIRFILR